MRSENSVAKKERDLDDYLVHLYVHANEIEHFTLFSGISVQRFLKFANLSSLLLLKHHYEDSSFNIHTQMDFIGKNQFSHFLKESAEKSTSLCFLDFSDEKRLNLLTPQEQAELLYIAHKKEAFRSPFYHHLQNRFVYLTDEDQYITKIYFRDIEDFYGLIADLFNQEIKDKTKSTAFWRKKNNIILPELSSITVEKYADFYEDGVLMSLFRVDKTNYGIEIRCLPENIFPDEVLEDVKHHVKRPYDFLIEI